MKMSGEKAIHRQELERGLLTQKISRLFLKYTIPGVAGLLFLGIQSVIDGVILGRFVGANALASVNLILPCYSLMTALSIVIGVGCQTLIGINLGRLDRQEANNAIIKKMQYVIQNFFRMKKTGNIQPDKLLWRVISDGADRFSETFDLAVAYLEGGSAYYVADHVNAKKKAAFVHIAYGNSGYTREMDRDCYEKMDQIFTVSQETRRHFLEFYPEYEKKVQVFHNILDTDRIAREAQLPGGFSDSYTGIRILTVGRLAYQKAYDIAIPAMKKIREDGYEARWYVLGEGSERNALEKQIAELGLQEDFQLPGAKENLFPYYAQCDLYVHATRFEGKSIAIQEAQTLGCAVIASDCAGNREQIVDGEDGLLCTLTPEGIAEKVEELLDDPKKRERLAAAANRRPATTGCCSAFRCRR